VPKKKILVVEPEKSLLELESMLLTAKGYEVRGVTGGRPPSMPLPRSHQIWCCSLSCFPSWTASRSAA